MKYLWPLECFLIYERMLLMPEWVTDGRLAMRRSALINAVNFPATKEERQAQECEFSKFYDDKMGKIFRDMEAVTLHPWTIQELVVAPKFHGIATYYPLVSGGERSAISAFYVQLLELKPGMVIWGASKWGPFLSSNNIPDVDWVLMPIKL
ncbi:MAG: hypothetical protein ACPGYT_11785 [Nitrospirales bacterium]